MIKNTAVKERIGRGSIIFSAILYIVIAFDFLNQNNYWLFAGIGAIGIANLIILKSRKNDTNLFGAMVNGLNLLAAGLIFLDHYQQNGRYLLWGFIALGYLAVTIMFIRRKRASTASNN